MTPFQSKVWSVINDYNDLFFAKRTNENAKELKEVYVLHIMNHLFKYGIFLEFSFTIFLNFSIILFKFYFFI